jgi:hypothetical protein
MADWNYIDDPNVLRVEEMHKQNGNIYCRSYYDGYSSKQKNNYFICKLDGNKFIPLCESNSNFPIKLSTKTTYTQNLFAVTSNENIYAIFDNSIYFYNNSKWTLFYNDTIINDTLLTLKTIHRDKFDNLWVIQSKMIVWQSGLNPIYHGVGGRLLKITDNKINKIIDTTYDDNYILKDFNLASSYVLNSDSKGNILSAESKYLFIYNPITNSFQTINFSTELGSNHCQPNDMFVDKDDKIWILFKNNGGISGGLVSIYDNGNWKYFNSDDGLSDSVASGSLGYSKSVYLANDNSLWIGSNYGAVYIKDKVSQIILPEFILPKTYTSAHNNMGINSFCEGDNGEIYLGAYPALLIYSGATDIENGNSQTKNEEQLFTPNPVTDFLYIQNNSNIEKIEIFSSLGIKVLETEYKNKIDVRNLPEGIYFIIFKSDHFTVSKKFIIVR